jgi:DUF4097 and DUF4098 domain-containing protein YvlB
VKKLCALLVGIAFVAGTIGSVAAQTSTTTTDKKPAADTKKDASAKKASTKTATGTVKSAAPDNIVVAGKDKGKDAEWTFAVDPKTKIRKGGKDIAATDLAAGDPVLVRYHEMGGKNVAESVMVRAAKKPAETTKADAPKKDETKK